MYSVVTYVDGCESESTPPMGYSEAYADYEAKAVAINYVNSKGKYTRPNERVAIRKV